MFDIAWSELLLIAVVALIFIGPKELPAVLYKLGQTLSKLRLTAEHFRRQFEASIREAGLEEMQKNVNDLRQFNPAHQLRETLSTTLPDLNGPVTPSAPTEGAKHAGDAGPNPASSQPTTGEASPPAVVAAEPAATVVKAQGLAQAQGSNGVEPGLTDEAPVGANDGAKGRAEPVG